MTISQVSVFIENTPGHLAEVTEILGENGIDLRALSIADTKDFGILRLIVDDPEKTATVLKNASCIVSVTPVLAVSLADKPGGLAKVLRVLSSENISIEYAYAFISRKNDYAYVVLRVEDNDRAEKLLDSKGIKTITDSDIGDL